MSASLPEVVVRGIAAGGDGVATLDDGRTVFIPRAAPGDRLQLRSVRTHARFARAEIAEILTHGPGRVTPPCPHYIADRCGSCQLMHLAPELQREVKARNAGDALRRIAKLDVGDPVVAPSPVQLGYRAKVTFAVSNGAIGYYRVGDSTRVFDVRDCLLAEPAVRRLHQALRSARTTLPANATRVVLRRDRDDSLHVVVRTDGDDAWRHGGKLHARLNAAGVEAVVWWHPEGGAPRAVAGSADPWPATVFEQIHPAMGRLVREAALDGLGDVAGAHVWDLYAGVGETTAALLARGATVESIELDARAVAYAERIGPAGAKRLAGRAEERIAELKAPGAIITNPPRTGMDVAVTAAIAESGARLVSYISCDAATLARDLSRLAGQYRLRHVAAFDQFPQTAHLESVALLERL
ncbi:MAG: hypothetical protein ABIZ70_12720 [Gemmatimonadales bacterium]